MPFPLAPWTRKGPAGSSGQGAQSGVGPPSGRWQGTAGNGDALTSAEGGSRLQGPGYWFLVVGEVGKAARSLRLGFPARDADTAPPGALGVSPGLSGGLLRPLSDERADQQPREATEPWPPREAAPASKPGVSDTLTQCNLIACDLWSQQKGYQRPHPGNKSKFRHGCKH